MLHDVDIVGELADDGQVMGDQDHRHAEFLLQVADEVEDLRLHGDVERCRRLVGNQHVRAVGKRHGDHDALALAAGELVRILVEAGFGIGDLDLAQKLQRPLHRLFAAHLLMNTDCLDDLRADRIDRVERAHRLLEDHRDAVAAQRPALAVGEFQDILAVVFDAGVRPRRWRAW